jgi:hypothetical protein
MRQPTGAALEGLSQFARGDTPYQGVGENGTVPFPTPHSMRPHYFALAGLAALIAARSPGLRPGLLYAGPPGLGVNDTHRRRDKTYEFLT